MTLRPTVCGTSWILLPALAGLFAFSAAAAASPEAAKRQFAHAQTLLSDLRAVPPAELGVEQYLLVVDAFREVHRIAPASAEADDALLAAADVLVATADRFGLDAYREGAADAYRFLVREYPGSPLVAKAADGLRRLGAPPPPTPAPPPTAPAPVREPESSPPAGTPVSLTAPRTIESSAQPPPNRLRDGVAQVTDLRYWVHPDYTRVILELDDYVPYKFDLLARPLRLYFDLFSSRLAGDLIHGASHQLEDPAVKAVRVAQNRSTKTRIVFDLDEQVTYDVSWLSNPPRLVIELRRADAPAVSYAQSAPPPPPPTVYASEATAREAAAGKPATFREAFEAAAARGQRQDPRAGATTAAPPEEAPAQVELASVEASAPPPARVAKTPPPPAPELEPLAPPRPAAALQQGRHSLTRALGLKIGRVVIDPGHGGHDPGSIGPSGLQEKDLVLDISLRLGRLIEQRLGAQVLYTRSDDRFVEHGDRTDFANDSGADLFVSVHANSSRSSKVRGIETYYLNATTDSWALQVAARENAAANRSVHELQDLLSEIVLREKIDESREFAARVQEVLYGGLSKTTKGLRNRGVRQAPFVVLIGAHMPAILAEIGFLSNPSDEKLLKQREYRQKIAELLYDGVSSYVFSLGSDEVTLTPQETAKLD